MTPNGQPILYNYIIYYSLSYFNSLKNIFFKNYNVIKSYIMIYFNLIRVLKNGNRQYICSVTDIDDILLTLGNRYRYKNEEKLEHIKNITFDNFKDEVDKGGKYGIGLYLLEIPNSLDLPNSLCVYCVLNKIKLVESFDVVLIQNY